MASSGLTVRNIKVWKHVPHFNLSSCNSLYYLHLFWEVCKNQNPMIYAICKEFQEKWSLLQNKSNAYFGKTEFVQVQLLQLGNLFRYDDVNDVFIIIFFRLPVCTGQFGMMIQLDINPDSSNIPVLSLQDEVTNRNIFS